MDGEPLVNKDFCEIVKYSKEIFPDKIFVLGTNAVLLRNNNHLIEFIKENFNEICIGCDLEHKNIEILREVIPKLCENRNITVVINSILEYSTKELLEELKNMKKNYNNIILVTNHVYHTCKDNPINKLNTKLCKQSNRKFLLVQENGDIYRCFNCCVPEDKEANIFNDNFYEIINKERTKHYKFCAWCSNYEP